MIKVVLIGGGNLAFHLSNHFQKSDLTNLIQVYNRNLDALDFLPEAIPKTNDINGLFEADLYVLAVSDDAISAVSRKMTYIKGLVLHTSGGKNLDELIGNYRKGVIYFPQSFTKGVETDFSKVPVCIEAEHQSDLQLLDELAHSFSNQVFEIDSKQRAYLHASAVFVNNFVNHMYTIGHEICEAQQIPFEILNPLIMETVVKIQKLAPLKAQTGPAIRKDEKTMIKHEALLNEQQRAIYELLSKSIQLYGKKL